MTTINTSTADLEQLIGRRYALMNADITKSAFIYIIFYLILIARHINANTVIITPNPGVFLPKGVETGVAV